MATSNPGSPNIVSELLDSLFKKIRHPSGREFTYQEVSRGVGGELDPTYIAKLRKGQIPNPGRNAVMLLCRFFKVQPSYFFPELQPSHDPSIPPEEDPLTFQLRSSHLEPHVRQKIEELIRALGGQNPQDDEP